MGDDVQSFFEVWDTQMGNLVRSFAAEQEALALIRSFEQDVAGREIAEHLVLGRIEHVSPDAP